MIHATNDIGLVGGGIFLGVLATLIVADLIAELRLHQWRQRYDPSLTTYLGVPLPWALRRLRQWKKSRP